MHLAHYLLCVRVAVWGSARAQFNPWRSQWESPVFCFLGFGHGSFDVEEFFFCMFLCGLAVLMWCLPTFHLIQAEVGSSSPMTHDERVAALLTACYHLYLHFLALASPSSGAVSEVIIMKE